MASRLGKIHKTDDTYMLQVLTNGNWHDVDTVKKQGAGMHARNLAKITKKRHRVINLSRDKAVYLDCDPR